MGKSINAHLMMVLGENATIIKTIDENKDTCFIIYSKTREFAYVVSPFSETYFSSELEKDRLTFDEPQIELESIEEDYPELTTNQKVGFKLIADAEDLLAKSQLGMSVDYNLVLTKFKEAAKKGIADAYAYFEMGICSYELGKYVDAIHYFTKSAQIFWSEENDESDFFFRSGRSYSKVDGNYKEILGVIFTRYRPHDILMFRGECKVRALDYYGAIEDLEHSVVDSPTFAAHYFLGYSYYKTGKHRSAMESLKKSLEYEEQEGKVYYLMGMCYLQMHDISEACRSWSRSGELGEKDAYELIKKYCQ